MSCPKCPGNLWRSDRESTVTQTVYRCSGCKARFKFVTTTGQMIEISKGLTAAGLLLSIALALLGIPSN